MHEEVTDARTVMQHPLADKDAPRHGGDMFLTPLSFPDARELQYLRQRLLFVDSPQRPHPLQQVPHRLLEKEPRGTWQENPTTLLQLHKLVHHRELPPRPFGERERAAPPFNIRAEKPGPLLQLVGELPAAQVGRPQRHHQLHLPVRRDPQARQLGVRVVTQKVPTRPLPPLFEEPPREVRVQ